MLLVMTLCLTTAASGQIFPGRQQILIAGDGTLQQEEPVPLENGAVLKTDPDLESIMEKADRFRQDDNYRVATQLWQAVLQRSGDALYSGDGEVYFSMVRQVEKVLSELPAEGLAAYRINADAEAAELLAAAGDPLDRAALNQVVRRYFLSSLGDEAAFRLGCLYLDEYDFIGARRLFEKVVNHYPDPSVPMAEIHARIALCELYLGDVDAAKGSVASAEELDGGLVAVNRLKDAIEEMESGNGTTPFPRPSTSGRARWQVALGGPGRQGVGLPVPKDMLEADLVAVWQFFYQPKDRYSNAKDTLGTVLVGAAAHGDAAAETRGGGENQMIDDWREKGWRPAGHLLLDGDRVFLKTGADLAVWSREKIDELIQASADVSAPLDASIDWRSVWRNTYEVDEATQTRHAILTNYGNAMGRRGQPDETIEPQSVAEIHLFGDTLAAQMSLINGHVYSIEGKSFDDQSSRITKRISPQWNQPYRRTRENFLTCYQAQGGAVQWQLPKAGTDAGEPGFAEAEEAEWLEDGGFMAAPIGYGELIIVPVNKGGAIWVYGLDPKQGGKTVWKSFLCDEPEAGAVAWAPINLSLDGSDLFVSCGMGVIFVLDPATGLIRFAKRYPRIGVLDPFYRRSNWTTQRAIFDGWSSDLVIPYGSQLICFASDTNVIEAIDRDNGQVIWRSEMSPIGYKVDYLLGIYDNMLYAAGTETIVAYDLNGEGRMVWGADQLYGGRQSLGRGLLTPAGIYMPVEDRIYHLDLKGDQGRAKVLAQAHVDLGGAPVGNLFSDGQRFWVHGANRLYALGKADQ